MFIFKTNKDIQKIMEQITRLEDSLHKNAENGEAALTQIQDMEHQLHGMDDQLRNMDSQLHGMDKQISRHDMAIENLLDELQEERENDFSAKTAENAYRETEENLLALIASYQEQFWQLRRFFSDKDEVWSGQLELMEQTLERARIHCGITEINRTGTPVDYQLHEVVDLVESDTYDKTVAEIYNPGYLYRGKVRKKAKIAAYRKSTPQMEEL